MKGWLKRIAIIVLALTLVPFVLVPVLAVVNPPATVSQLWKWIGGAPIRSSWVPLTEISRHLPAAVVTSEDGRFCSHHGVDWDAVQTVVEDKLEHPGKQTRGASTLTMQLAKNLFFPPGRSYVRKVFEVPLALWIDLIWPKRRQMEVYLNIVEWAPGVYGAEAAARHHFRKKASRLSRTDAARLAAALPNPIVRSAGRPGPYTRRTARRIERRMSSIGPYTSCLR
ncbi:MAG: monofunctional biosynthetic peptidoglycan transglycosylase [Pseudomonadota bacterium]